MRMRLWIRRLTIGFLTAVAAVVAAAWIASQTTAVRQWARARVLTALAEALRADVRVGGVGGTLGRSLVLTDVAVATGGRTVLRVARLELTYALLPLLRGHVLVRRMTLDGPDARLVRDAAGWRLPPAGGDGAESPVSVEIRRLRVRGGRLAVALLDEPDGGRRLAARTVEVDARVRVAPRGWYVDVERLALVPRGVAVSPVAARGRAARDDDGTLRVDGAEVATARSRLTLAGAVRPGNRVEVRLAALPLVASELGALVPAARPLRSDVHATLDAAGPWSAVATRVRLALGAGGSAALDGRLDLAASPPAYRARVAVDALAPNETWFGAPEARLSGRGRARGRVAAVPPQAWQLALADSIVTGRRIDRVRAVGGTRGRRHRVRAEAAAPEATLAVRARAAGRPLVYRAGGRLRVARLEALLPAVPGAVDARFRLRGRGLDARDRAATLDLRAAGRVHDVAVEEARLDALVAGPAIRVSHLDVRGPALTLAGRGEGDTAARTVAAEATATADLARIPAAGASGRLEAKARIDGAFDALRIEGSAAMAAFARDAVRADRVGLSLRAEGVGGPRGGGTLRATASALRWETIAPREATAEVGWAATGGTHRVTVAATAWTAAGTPTERLAARVETDGTHTRGELSELRLTPPVGAAWTLARAAPFSVDDALHVPALAVVSGGGRASLRADVGRRGPVTAHLAVRQLDLGPLCEAFLGGKCAGLLEAQADLAGTAAAPALVASFDVRGLRLATIDYGSLHGEARAEGAVATVAVVARHPTSGDLRLTGTVPVAFAWDGPPRDVSDDPLLLTVRAQRLDVGFLAALAGGEVRDAAGVASVDLRATGSRASPVLEGSVLLDEGRFTVAAAGVPYRDVRARLSASGGALVVDELTARSGDGTATARGRVLFGGGRAPALDLELGLRSFFAVSRPAFDATVSGTMHVRGTVLAPAVAGTVDVERAVVRPAALPGTGMALAPDPTIEVVDASGAAVAPPATRPPDVGDALAADLHVRIRRNAWIRRADANIELAGDLEIDKVPYEEERLSGTIRLLHGWYTFQGRRFEIEEGTIRFTGDVPPAPLFDVTAIARLPEYRVIVHVTGSSDRPKLELSSEPPLEQADILSVLLFGKPTTQLGRGESLDLQRQAVQLAAGYVMPELRTSVMNTLGLDELAVEMPQGRDASGRELPGRVSVGRYIAPDVMLSLAQEFGARAGQVVGIEYGVTPNISLRGSTSTRGDSAVDLFWHRRY
jgi:translocation and assembly module TamB